MSNRQNAEQTVCRQTKCRTEKLVEKEENGERTECRNLNIKK